MKTEYKIYLSNLVYIVLIIVVGSYAMNDLDQLLAKFHFAVIADGLNMSFLEMRLAEKNYVLYGDDDALQNIRNKIAATTSTLIQNKQGIIQALGRESLTCCGNTCTSMPPWLIRFTRNNSKTRGACNNCGRPAINSSFFRIIPRSPSAGR